MSPLLSQPVFQVYALCTSIIIVMLYGLGFWTAKVRNDHKLVINHEDVRVNVGGKPVDVEHEAVQRIKRAHTNALENAVPFFIIGFLYTQTDASLNTARGVFFAFVAVRLFHALFYLNAKQPFRTMSFAIGAIINLFMVLQVVRAVL